MATLEGNETGNSSSAAAVDPTAAAGSDEYNVFRDSLLRYAGYANEIGESFRYQFPRLVLPSYAVSFGYCLADAASTGYGAYSRRNKGDPGSDDNDDDWRLHAAATGAFDTLLWQSLASVMIPGATINAIVRAARFAVPRLSPAVALPVAVAKWLPTATGLGSIPLIVRPIDHGVDHLLDNTARQFYKVER